MADLHLTAGPGGKLRLPAEKQLFNGKADQRKIPAFGVQRFEKFADAFRMRSLKIYNSLL